jgi:glutathionyl-hydroquinone reductase
MGVMINGQWHQDATAVEMPVETVLGNWVTVDGSAGPSGASGFRAERGRYHLYAAKACPFAHRALSMRALKGLEKIVPLTFTRDIKRHDGWELDPGADPVFNERNLHGVFAKAEPDYTGRAAVPVLLDKTSRRIVSTNSADIARMFETAFDDVGALPGDYYPGSKATAIDELNGWLQDHVNFGVYRVGFSLDQAEYEEAIESLFLALDTLETRLDGQRYLHGDDVTESDIWLFATLIRFDAVYALLFKCSRRRIADYPNLFGYLRDLYAMPELAGTVDLDGIKRHYYLSLMHNPAGALDLNPSGLVPDGPELNLSTPHGREKFNSAVSKRQDM